MFCSLSCYNSHLFRKSLEPEPFVWIANKAYCHNWLQFLVLTLLLSIGTPVLALDARDSRLLLVGGEFFPRIVQALTPDEQATYQLVVIYSSQSNKQLAQPIAKHLSDQLNFPYTLVSGLDPTQLTFDKNHQYLIFLADPALINSALVDAVNQPNTLSFSPFIGSVPLGFDVGLVVKASIRPQLNRDHIANKNWTFRPFFKTIADQYPPQEKP